MVCLLCSLLVLAMFGCWLFWLCCVVLALACECGWVLACLGVVCWFGAAGLWCSAFALGCWVLRVTLVGWWFVGLICRGFLATVSLVSALCCLRLVVVLVVLRCLVYFAICSGCVLIIWF